MRALALGVLAGIGTCAAASAALADAVTTRIETRPFYGATVTLEEGVRVFRPLPSHDRVIINPGGKTPLSLGFYESRNYSFNEYVGGGRDVVQQAPDYYGYGGFAPRGRGGRHGRHGRHGHGHRLAPMR